VTVLESKEGWPLVASAGKPLGYLRLKLAVRAWALWIPVLAQGRDLKTIEHRRRQHFSTAA
jgi:hypothetical protein